MFTPDYLTRLGEEARINAKKKATKTLDKPAAKPSKIYEEWMTVCNELIVKQAQRGQFYAELQFKSESHTITDIEEMGIRLKKSHPLLMITTDPGKQRILVEWK